MIQLKELSKTLGNQEVLSGLSLTITAGEKLALIGLRGSGKTLLLQILCGYTPASSGELIIAGFPMKNRARQAKKHLGYAPREAPLYPELTLTEYLTLIFKLRELPASSTRVEEVLRDFQLQDFAQQRLGELARGPAQQLNLAQALLHNPDILLLDDIFIDLDVFESQRLRALLTEHKQNRCFLLATHDLYLAQDLCDRVLILDQGRLCFDGPISVLKQEDFFNQFFPKKEGPDAEKPRPLAP